MRGQANDAETIPGANLHFGELPAFFAELGFFLQSSAFCDKKKPSTRMFQAAYLKERVAWQRTSIANITRNRVVHENELSLF